jgi:hypothetical protein
MHRPAETSALEWVRDSGPGTRFWCPLDNYEPGPRNVGAGVIWRYARTDAAGGAVLTWQDWPRDAHRAIYLLDDGRTVTPHYVAGWPADDRPEPYLLLAEFPTNYHRDGRRRTRENDGRPVDMGLWALGPRRTFHLKLKETP